MRRICSKLAAAAILLAPALLSAKEAPEEYRGFWVDTFNTAWNTHADVVAIVGNAVAARANALFVQARRRGDSWYLKSLEPPPDGVPIQPGFDPLDDLIVEAHGRGIEVHAFVVVGSIWNQSLSPSSPNHVFNRHGFNQATGAFHQGRDNWLTRTLLPDGSATSMQGYRFGTSFFLDLGHPDAAAYTVDVLMQLVRNYDIDGLHLDYIRYPEISISGQTPATGASVGYNETSVARFQRLHGIAAGSPPPTSNDPRWTQWRRDQVTQFVRRLYLNAAAEKPGIRISAALICFGGGPVDAGDWVFAEAFWRVYQDWRAWTEEGILDLAIPMVYKTEHTASGRAAFDQWNEWTKNHQYGRAAALGIYLNSVEGTLLQARRAFAASAAGRSAAGVTFFSMAVTNAAVAANPLSLPAGQDTPLRPFSEFAAALTTGRSADGARPYEDPAANPVPLFPAPAAVPRMPWKSSPAVGHLMGQILDESGAALDSGGVTILRVDSQTAPGPGRTSVAVATDGQGFYGGVDLMLGTYSVTVTTAGRPPFTPAGTVAVAAGRVSRFDFALENPQRMRIERPARALPAPRTVR